MKQCPICKAPIEMQSAFCTACGVKNADVSSYTNTIHMQGAVLFALVKYCSLVYGAIIVICWFISDSKCNVFFINYYKEIKPILWLALYGRFLIGLLSGIIGVISVAFKNMRFGYVFLILSGVFVLLWDFIAIPGLSQYGEVVTVTTILQEMSGLWILIGLIGIISGIGMLLINKKC